MPADLLRHNCLTLPGPAWSQWPFHTHEGINRLAVAGSFTSDNADLLLDMAVAGLGIARLADFMVARAVQQGTLVPLLGWMNRKHDELRAARGRQAYGQVTLEGVMVVSATLALLGFGIWFFFFSGSAPIPVLSGQ